MYAEECLNYIQALSIPDGYSFDLLWTEEGRLFEEGKRALDELGADWAVCARGGVFLLNRNFIGELLSVVERCPDVGVLGVLGISALPRRREGEIWDVGQAVICDGSNAVRVNYTSSAFGMEEVAAVDGMLTAFRRGADVRVDGNGQGESYVHSGSGRTGVLLSAEPQCLYDSRVMRPWEGGTDRERASGNRREIEEMRDLLLPLMEAGAVGELTPMLPELRRLEHRDDLFQKIYDLIEAFAMDRSFFDGVFGFAEAWKKYRKFVYLLRRMEFGIGGWERLFSQSGCSGALLNAVILRGVWEKARVRRLAGIPEQLVSVVIPVYNRQEQIAGCIESVLRQTYLNLQVIIVDDGSTDRTAEIVRGFADDRLSLVGQENRGANAARNKGIDMAEGRYIAFNDSDAGWHEEKLENQVALMEVCEPNTGVIYCRSERIGKDNQIVERSPHPSLAYEQTSGNIFRELLFNMMVSTPMMLVKRECFQRVGKFNERLRRLQDWELCVRIAEHYSFYMVDRVLSFDSDLPDRLSRNNVLGYIDTLIEVMDRYAEEIKSGSAYRPMVSKAAAVCLTEGGTDKEKAKVLDKIKRDGVMEADEVEGMERCLFGPAHLCASCGWEVSYLPTGIAFTENKIRYGFPYYRQKVETIDPFSAACPKCGALERDRLLLLFLREYVERRGRRLRFLQIAPSPAVERWAADAGEVDYESTDLFMEGVSFRSDIQNMNMVEDETYDAVVCFHVLEHVENDRKAMRELYRITAQDGICAVLVPLVEGLEETDEEFGLSAEENWRRFGQGDHCRLYARKDFISRLEEAGFNVNRLGKEEFSPEIYAQYGFNDNSVLYICTKGRRLCPE